MERQINMNKIDPEDIELLEIAVERINYYSPNKLTSLDKLDSKLGFTESELIDTEDVEFEW